MLPSITAPSPGRGPDTLGSRAYIPFGFAVPQNAEHRQPYDRTLRNSWSQGVLACGVHEYHPDRNVSRHRTASGNFCDRAAPRRSRSTLRHRSGGAQDAQSDVGKTVPSVFLQYWIDRRGKSSQHLDNRGRSLQGTRDHSEHLTRPLHTHIEPRIMRQAVFFRRDRRTLLVCCPKEGTQERRIRVPFTHTDAAVGEGLVDDRKRGQILTRVGRHARGLEKRQ